MDKQRKKDQILCQITFMRDRLSVTRKALMSGYDRIPVPVKDTGRVIDRAITEYNQILEGEKK